MLNSTTGVFREPVDLQAAMAEFGCASLVCINSGSFRARLTRIALHRLRLLKTEESAARVAFFCTPDDAMLVSLPVGDGPSVLWGGTAARAGEILVVGPGHRSYSRSTARLRWGAILLPIRLSVSYAQRVSGNALALPPGVSLWRPSTKDYKALIQLHTSATRVANARSDVVVTSEPARSLEHELIGAVVDCLSGRPTKTDNIAEGRHTDIMARFEELLQARPDSALASDAICEALNISGRTLRAVCDGHLGMGPNAFIRIRRMQLVRGALSGADPATANVAQIAAQFGFTQTGRFAGIYRDRFGELPSATLRRSAD
jgi:AraC-like DNA-binding protein